MSCPAGASNINGPTVADPETGVLFVTTQRLCRSENMVPGEKMDEPEDPKTTGRTVARWVVANRGDLRGPQGLPIWKPPYSRIIAIDMTTGEFLWETPNGDTPEHVAQSSGAARHEDSADRPDGACGHDADEDAAAHGARGRSRALRARQEDRPPLATVKLPAPGQYGMMGYLHRGRQYVVVQVGSPTHPGSLVALRLKG